MVRYEEIKENKIIDFPTVALSTLGRMFGGIVYSALEIPMDKADEIFVNVVSTKQIAAAMVANDKVIDCVSLLCMSVDVDRSVSMLHGSAFYCPDKNVLIHFYLVGKVLLTIQRKAGVENMTNVAYGTYTREQALDVAKRAYAKTMREKG